MGQETVVDSTDGQIAFPFFSTIGPWHLKEVNWADVGEEETLQLAWSLRLRWGCFVLDKAAGGTCIH